MSLVNDGIPMTMPVQPANSSNGNGNGMWGGDGWWVIVLFLIWGMWGGNWGNGSFGNGGSAATQGALTREQACIDNNFQNLMRETAAISDAVNGGFSTLDTRVCQQQYETARQLDGINSTIQSGFGAANVVALQNANAIQAQQAQCCCEQKAATADLKYTIANEDCQTRNLIQNTTRDMIDNNNANTRAILDKLTQQEMAAKDAQISALNQQLFRADLAASQAAQNTYLVDQLSPKCPIPAFLTCNPYTGQSYTNGYGYGYNNGGCGCNSGCACA